MSLVEVPGGSPGVDRVLDQTLTWLRRSVGFDAARVLAYDPAVLIPVSIAASDPLPWEQVVVPAATSRPRPTCTSSATWPGRGPTSRP